MIHRITILFLSLCAIAFAQPSLTNNNLDNLTPTAKDNLEALGVLTDEAGPDNAAVAAAIAGDPAAARTELQLSSDRGVGESAILDIPTHDGIGSTTHPSVVFFEKPWNGFHYWMAHTPFPDASREFPNICASNDGETWVVPDGLTNPIYTAANMAADGGNWTADTELVFVEGELQCWFLMVRLSDGGSTYMRMRSTDGVNWSPREIMPVSGHTLVYDDDTNTLHAWWPSAGGIKTASSTDNGATWTEPEQCVIPSGNIYAWHIMVRKFGGRYHLLLQTDSTGGPDGILPDRLFYLSSADGVTWTGKSGRPLPTVHAGYFGNYRSAFVPKLGPGGGLLADIWVSNRTFGIAHPSGGVDVWKLSLLRDFQLNEDDRAPRWQDVYALMRNTTDVPLTNGLWTKSGVGGTINSVAWPLRLTTGATANNICVARVTTNAEWSAPPIWTHGTGRLDWRYRRPVALAVTLQLRGTLAADNRVWILSHAIGGTLDAIPDPLTWPTFGIRVDQNALKVIAFDGTNQTVSNTGVTLSSYQIYHISIETSGNELALYLDGALQGLYPGGPLDVLTQNKLHTPLVAIANGASGGDKEVVIGKLLISRLPNSPNP